MVDETRPGMFQRDQGAGSGGSVAPSRASAIGAVICTVTALAGMLGQILLADAVAWEMVTALGLAGLATLVLSHQR